MEGRVGTTNLLQGRNASKSSAEGCALNHADDRLVSNVTNYFHPGQHTPVVNFSFSYVEDPGPMDEAQTCVEIVLCRCPKYLWDKLYGGRATNASKTWLDLEIVPCRQLLSQLPEEGQPSLWLMVLWDWI